MGKKVLHQLHIVSGHPDYIAGTPSHHVGRGKPIEFFKKRNAHLGQQPKCHVVRNPRFQPMKDPRNGRHNAEQDQQIHEGLVRFNRTHRQRTDHANADKGQHPRHPKTKGHDQPSFIGHDVLHQLARGRDPAKALRLNNGVGGSKLRLLAIKRHFVFARLQRCADVNTGLGRNTLFGLTRHQAMVDTALLHQLRMGTLLGDGALVQHQNAISIDHAGQAMGKDQRGAPLHQPIKRDLDDGLVLGIHCRECFIQNQNRSIAQNSPRNGDPLALPTRKANSSLTDNGVVALGQKSNKLMGIGGTTGRLKIIQHGIGLAHPKVIRHRAMKKISVLVDHRDLRADIIKTEIFQIVATNLDRPIIWIIKAQQ